MLRLVGAVAALLALIAAGRLAIAAGPVPITLQSLVVVLAGAWLGSRFGTGAVVAWLGLAAAGLPVLAGGKAGLPDFAEPSAGFLLALPLAALLAGSWRRDWQRLPTLGLMLGCHALLLAVGGLWIALAGGNALAVITPLLPGALLKSALAALILGLSARAPARWGMAR
jgi:biotin transport system substrate-specific component